MNRRQEQIGLLEHQTQVLQAKQYDTCIDLVKKNNQLEAQILKLKASVDNLQEEKRGLKEELSITKEQLKVALEEKIALETQLHGMERTQSQQHSDATYQLHTLRANLSSLTEDADRLRRDKEQLLLEVTGMAKARDSFKQQYLELKEANKELRQQFKDLEGKVSSCVTAAKIKEEQENMRPVQKAALMGEIHGLIKDYRRNASEKRAL